MSGRQTWFRGEARERGPSTSMSANTLECRARIWECAGSSDLSSSFSRTSQLFLKLAGALSRYKYSDPMGGALCCTVRNVLTGVISEMLESLDTTCQSGTSCRANAYSLFVSKESQMSKVVSWPSLRLGRLVSFHCILCWDPPTTHTSSPELGNVHCWPLCRIIAASCARHPLQGRVKPRTYCPCLKTSSLTSLRCLRIKTYAEWNSLAKYATHR